MNCSYKIFNIGQNKLNRYDLSIIIQWAKEEEEAFKAKVVEAYDQEGGPYYATARLWDDGIIDPADTRKVLGLCLSASVKHETENTRYGVFRM